MQILKILPKNLISLVVGQAAQVQKPEKAALKLRDWFIKRYNINLAEAELPLHEYRSLAQLFTRKLKPGVRPLATGIVHPCDGVLTVAEHIENHRVIQAKGRHYSLPQLLNDSLAMEQYQGGTHIVYYLCPTDYHRVHAPLDAEIVSVIHVPGYLWPVNQWSTNNIDELFAVNERVIFNMKTPLGPVAMVMVGATNVGRISVSFDADICTNRMWQSHLPFEKHYPKPIRIQKGDEMGVFNMGSTVVMVYGPNMVNVLPHSGPVKLGEKV